LVSLYFWFMMGKSSWVPLVLRVYSHLLQVVRCIMATARITSIPLWMRSETMGVVFYVVLPMMLLLEMTLNWHVLELCVMLVLKLCCFRYIWTWVVITLHKLRCMLNYLWTCCNMWQCMLNHVRSWLYVGDDSRYFMILDGLPGLYEPKCVRVNV
jgi:hypothetical protein